MAARRAHNPEVAGSSPVPAKIKRSLERETSAFLKTGLEAKVHRPSGRSKHRRPAQRASPVPAK